MPLGNLIARARKAKKLSLQGLADKMGVTKQLVWQWEQGTSDARTHIKALSEHLEMPIDYFYGAKGQPGVLEAKIQRLAPDQRAAVEAMVEAFLRQQEVEPAPPRKRA